MLLRFFAQQFREAIALITSELPFLLDSHNVSPRPLLRKIDAWFSVPRNLKRLDQWHLVCEQLSKAGVRGFEATIRLATEAQKDIRSSELSVWVSRFSASLICPEVSRLMPHLRLFAASEAHYWGSRRTRAVGGYMYSEEDYVGMLYAYWREFEWSCHSEEHLRKLGHLPPIPIAAIRQSNAVTVVRRPESDIEDPSGARAEVSEDEPMLEGLGAWLCQVECIKIATAQVRLELAKLRGSVWAPSASIERLCGQLTSLKEAMVANLDIGYLAKANWMNTWDC